MSKGDGEALGLQPANENELNSDTSARTIADEARHSLFFDTIDPRFRPDPGSGTNKEWLDKQSPDNARGRSDKDKPEPGSAPEAQLKIEEKPRAERDIYREGNAQLSPVLPYSPSNNGRDDINNWRANDLFRENRQRWLDEQADRVFPGFGRLEGKGPKQDWRIDYLDSKNCRVRVGVCFTMKLH